MAREKDKYKKSEVNYEPEAGGKDHCSICRHFVEETDSNYPKCAIVRGGVEPSGWCEKFRLA
jgi:High potential iron-sulfur protein